MIPSPADGTLLFGLLALRTGLVTQEALLEALRAWTQDKARPLGQLLCEQGALAAEDREPLEALASRHQERAADALAALGSLAPLGSLPQEIEEIGDPDLTACLTRLGENRPAVTERQPQYASTLDYTSADAAATLAAEAVPGAARPSDRSGTRYRVLRPHARGGLGEVFVALDVELRREVALKEIQGRHADRADSRARFLLEAEVTGRLEHPGVVPVYGLGCYVDGRPFYAMRFVKGDSLKDAIKRFHRGSTGKKEAGARTLELRQLLRRFVDVCNAVAYAHSKGVLHRDLKPENIMLGAYGETLVVDWGLAKIMTGADTADAPVPVKANGSVAGAVIGTPQYMAPEQAAGKNDQLGPASDVYALGATLYHLLAGKRPFPDDDVAKVLRLVQSGAFPPPREINAAVPRALEAVCLQAMSLRPQDRYGSPKELAADVERWLADEPVSAWREPLLVRLRRWGRRHQTLVTSSGVLCVTLVAALFVGYLVVSQEQRAKLRERDQRLLEQQEKLRERDQRLLEQREKLRERDQRVLAQVDALLNAEPQAVPALLEALEPVRAEVRPRLLQVRLRPTAPNAAQRRHFQTRASLALLGDDPEQVAFLRERLLDERLDPDETLLIREFLNPYHGRLEAGLWEEAQKPGVSPSRRFLALVALAAFDADSPHWKECGALVVERLLVADPIHLGIWTDALRPVSEALNEPLGKAFRSPTNPSARRVAAGVLRAYADQPALVADLLADADEEQFALLYPRLQEKAHGCIPVLERELAKRAEKDWSEARRVILGRRQANCAVALLRLKRPERVWRLLPHSAYPDTRTFLIHFCAPLGVDPRLLADRLKEEPDVSAKRALVLALGEYTAEQLGELPSSLAPRLLEWYGDHPDPGLHAAIGWLLGHNREGRDPRRADWSQAAAVHRMYGALKGKPPSGGKRWYVNGQGMTMVLLGPAVFMMGAPPLEPEYESDETLHRCRIGRTFALASTEVTVAQFRRFLKAHPEVKHSYPKKHSPDGDGPIVSVTWYEAAQFCRWLSEQEGIPEEQMCYPSVAEIEKCKDGKTVLKLPADFLARTGYRLPTEAEWEYACRADSLTSRPHGASAEMLSRYAWDVSNALARAWPVGQKRPNDFGLFDMHGNAAEWCQDEYRPYPTSKDGKPVADVENSVQVTPDSHRVLRGAPFYPRPAPLRSAYRYWHLPSDRFSTVGLRVAHTQSSGK
jgi:formylglycine-generating enzyme required for sulfatase activity/tRNA A-37 threonylcarbamoyl transferase component Bud32